MIDGSDEPDKDLSFTLAVRPLPEGKIDYALLEQGGEMILLPREELARLHDAICNLFARPGA